MKQNVNRRLIIAYVIIFTAVFQDGVDFQMRMFLYNPPNHKCVPPNVTDVSVAGGECFYFHNKTTFRCQKWTFDESQIKTTVVTEMQLVCQYNYLHLLMVPLFNFAGIFGILVGVCADLFGRKLVFVTLVTVDTMLWITLGVIPTSYAAHLAVMLVKSMLRSSTSVGFVLVSEITPMKYRNMLAINYWVIFGVGLAVAPGYMKATLNWRSSWLIAASPMIIYTLSPYFLLESPKWLLINKRNDAARDVLKALDQYSNEEDMDVLIKENNGKEKHDVERELKSFCTSHVLICRLFVLLFMSFSFFVSYQGIATNLTFASKDIFINAVFLGIIEAPAGPLASICNKYIGSVRSIVVCIGVGLISYAVSPIVWKPSLAGNLAADIVHLILACLSKLMLTAAWNIQTLFFVTLIPTNLRNIFMNLGSVCGIIGAAFGGFIGYYFQSKALLADAIYCILLVMSAVFCGLCIPSQHEGELPNTVEDCENIPNKFPCCGNDTSNNDKSYIRLT